ncbi:hypothetical protein LF1_44170 [Rubripirellula obstinata]|uniref:Uncharacterized protein n=1 Tax=Rubripirellula obstinata TaxID=406547 RepID=A0A5B1CMR7_9BACT|nr:hypothetical protein [Rubripirellula obstinata]KAA1261856.1 hypothetical protein LF1_44170 [Rubripirellula obstinata]
MSRAFVLSIVATIVVVTGRFDRQSAVAQMIYQDVTNNQFGSSYFESNSVGGFLQGDNWFFNFGGAGVARQGFAGQGPLLTPFGGAGVANGGGLSGRGRFNRGRVSGGLGFNFSQGSARTSTSTSAGVTTMDGFPGSIQSGTIRPFVIGIIPVVSDFPQPDNSESVQNVRQLAKLRQSQQQLQDRRLQTFLQRIRQAESSGNVRMARANYRSAIAITRGPLQRQLKQNLQTFMANAKQQAKQQDDKQTPARNK